MARTLRLTPTPRTSVEGRERRVITPNKRAAAALGVRYESIDTLAKETLQGARLLLAPELAVYRALRRAVAEVLSPEDVTGTARSVRGVVREVLRAGLPERTPDDPKTARLLAVVRRYRALLGERGFIDAAELTRRAAGAVRERVVLSVWGYPRLEPSDLSFLDKIAADGSSLILPYAERALFADNRDAAEFLTERGWSVEHDNEHSDNPGDETSQHFLSEHLGTTVSRRYATGQGTLPDSVTAMVYPDIEREVRGVLTEVKRLLHRGVAADDIVLMTRQDDRYGPLVTAVAWEYEVPVRTFYRVPATQTRLGGWLEHLIAVLRSGGAFEPTARFLAHPLTASLGKSLGKSLDKDVWQQVRKQPPQTLAGWLEPLPHLTPLRWPASATTATYLEQFRHVLAAFGLRTETLPDFPSRMLLKRLQQALVSLDSSADTSSFNTPQTDTQADTQDDDRPLADFLTDLSDLLLLLDAPTDSPREGVSLQTPLALYGASYDHVFVLGLAEGILPATIREEPLLDYNARRRLRADGYRLESAAEAAKRERLSLFNALSIVGQTLHLSYPQQAFGRSQLPSETFARLGIKPTPPARKPLASAEEARVAFLDSESLADSSDSDVDSDVESDGEAVGLDKKDGETDAVLTHARHARAVEHHRESAEPPDAYDGVTGDAIDADERTFSASQLTMFGQCPYRWFAQKVLRIDEPEEADVDLSPSLRGSLYHRVLELVLTLGLNPSEQRVNAEEGLEPAFRRAETELQLTHLPSWPARRDEHLRQLRRVIQSESFLSDEDVVVGLEQHFETTWRGLKVRGVVDRIDRNADGLSLIDYKTSGQKPKGAKDADGKATLDVQLPLYLEAAAPALYPGEPVGSARYYSLTKTKTLAEAKPESDALDRLVDRVRTQLAQGSFPVDPDVQYHACTYCPYDSVCRKGPRLERKRSSG